MNRGGTGGRRGRQAATSYVQVAAAVAVLLVVGVIAEFKSRELSIQTQRSEIAVVLETLRTRLEGTLGDQLDVLSRLAGTMAAVPDMPETRFQDIAGALMTQATPVTALAAAWDDGRLQLRGARYLAEPLRLVLDGADPERPGAGSLTGVSTPVLALWQPVAAGGEVVSRGYAVAVIDTGALFAVSGLADAASLLDLALAAVPVEAGERRRALHYGHGSVLLRSPVTVNLAMPGGAWTLAAAPRGGWSVSAAAIWPIRVLALLSVGLVAFPMLRTRALMLERQEHISELHHREAQLRRLSERLGLALDASKVGVWDFNIDTGELIWDGRMDELYAVPAGKPARGYADWQERLHPEDLDRAQAEFADAIRTGSNYRSDYRLLLPGGAICHIRAIGSPSRDEDGGTKLIGVNWDVTADVERRAELEARRHEAEVATVAKSQFLATMSHEIRTPMNGVIGMLDLLLRSPLDAEQHERARIARRSAEHLLALLNDVLDLSKLEADRITIDAVPLDPAAMAREVVALLSAVAMERALEISVVVDRDVPAQVQGDPTRLRQVMINLVGNAIKFTDAGSVELRVGYDPAGGTLRVAVRDTGIGIPEAARRTLFQRFAQADGTDVRQRGGTGLGLAISKQLVELMGGGIGVESVEGLGSTFSFCIPAPPCAAPVEDAAAPAGRDVAAIDDAPRNVSARILVAEDNPTNQKVLLAYLEMAGHDTFLVTNGAEAVAAAAAGAYDLVLLDIQMPVMDGLDAARAIRAQCGSTARVPILALTASAAEGDRERFHAAGITDYLTKPVTMQALFAAIARASEGYSSPSVTGAQPSPGSNVSMRPATASVSSPRSAS